MQMFVDITFARITGLRKSKRRCYATHIANQNVFVRLWLENSLQVCDVYNKIIVVESLTAEFLSRIIRCAVRSTTCWNPQLPLRILAGLRELRRALLRNAFLPNAFVQEIWVSLFRTAEDIHIHLCYGIGTQRPHQPERTSSSSRMWLIQQKRLMTFTEPRFLCMNGHGSIRAGNRCCGSDVAYGVADGIATRVALRPHYN